ncbi:MAG: regulatory protein RecX [Rikenellaceae bacterium]
MRREAVKTIRTKSPEQALAALQRQCARAEKSSGDAMRLMSRWGVDSTHRAEILERLISDRFIDDRRFAEAYMREKLNLSGWGARKIASSLRTKGVSNVIIEELLTDLDRPSMQKRLADKVARKARTTKYKDRYDLRGKLIRYALSLGYEYDIALEVVSQQIEIEDEY